MASNDSRDTDLKHLHPEVRRRCTAVLAKLADAGLPFQIFEAYRTPQRQAWLYAQGRTREGNIVTNAPSWSSYHQFGMAADFVLKDGGNWSWSSSGKWKNAWKDLHTIARAEGLEPLSWELPHLQASDLTLEQLRAGQYPADGDDDWAEHLEGQIAGWSGAQKAPPAPAMVERPALPAAALEELLESIPLNGISPLAVNDLPPVGSAGWHNKFGGQDWKYDGDGVYLRSYSNGTKPIRSPGTPTTLKAIWDEFGTIIMVMAKKYGMAPEIILMTIATETAAYKAHGFTGPATFRWEAHVWNKDVTPPVQGDYSAGPMQTLGTTARWVIAAQNLPFHPFQVAPVYSVKPATPATHPLYDPATNIEIGAAEIKQRLGVTGQDPMLIAAAFNAGGVYENHGNAWHIKTYGNHLDRAAQWFGDACAVLKQAGVR